MCNTKSFAHFFLYIVAFVSTISLHVTLIFFAPGSKKLPSARPCVLLFHKVKGLSEFLKDDWITCNALELWTLLAFPLVPDSAVAHRSFRCWDRSEAVAKPTPTMICYNRHQQIPICRSQITWSACGFLLKKVPQQIQQEKVKAKHLHCTCMCIQKHRGLWAQIVQNCALYYQMIINN